MTPLRWTVLLLLVALGCQQEEPPMVKSEMEPVTLCELPPGVALPFIHRCVFYGQTLSFVNGRLFFTEEPYRDMTLTYIDTQEQLGYSIVQATSWQLEWYQRQESHQERLGRSIVEVTVEEWQNQSLVIRSWPKGHTLHCTQNDNGDFDCRAKEEP